MVATALYVLVVLASPTKRCGRCKGHRVIIPKPGKNGKPRRSKPKPCTRCRVTGRRYRFGATAIHRFKWSVINGRHHSTTLSSLERQADELRAEAGQHSTRGDI